MRLLSTLVLGFGLAASVSMGPALAQSSNGQTYLTLADQMTNQYYKARLLYMEPGQVVHIEIAQLNEAFLGYIELAYDEGASEEAEKPVYKGEYESFAVELKQLQGGSLAEVSLLPKGRGRTLSTTAVLKTTENSLSYQQLIGQGWSVFATVQTWNSEKMGVTLVYGNREVENLRDISCEVSEEGELLTCEMERSIEETSNGAPTYVHVYATRDLVSGDVFVQATITSGLDGMTYEDEYRFQPVLTSQ